MSAARNVRKVFKRKSTLEGAGVRLNRVFGFSETPVFDPFLLLDDFRSDNPDDYIKGFPWHPHRGIETITYVLRGTVEHGDSMGNTGTIGPGDVQWMTAGSGIIHQEMPNGDPDGSMWGFQLWANLPAKNKMMNPRYQEITSRDIPEIILDSGVKIRIICGTIGNKSGPVRDIVTNPEYLDVTIPEHTRFTHFVERGHTVFAYVFDGNGYFCGEKNPYAYDAEGANYFDIDRHPFMDNGTLVLYDDGDEITVFTEDQPVRFLLVSGKPIGEPIAWYGPIVMNTQKELQRAFDEFRDGSFVKYRK